jgi:CheY-like chemotaxis protein
MAESTESLRAKKSILVVEDHEYSARIYCDFLKVWGYRFHRVANGAEAVVAASEKVYDAILMDVMMPGLDGYEATERILAAANEKSLPYIVGVTANTLEDDLMRCRSAGMSQVVIKPVDFEQLEKLLDSALLNGETPQYSQTSAQGPSHSPKSSSSNVVDQGIAHQFFERMSEIPRADDPLDAFSHSVGECMEKLEQAVELGDREEIENCAHILKSLAGLVGGRDLEDLSRGLEDAAKRGGPNFRPMHWFVLISDAVKALRTALLA